MATESDIPVNKGGASAPTWRQTLLTVNVNDPEGSGRGLLIDGSGQVPITYVDDSGNTITLTVGLLGGVIHPIRALKYTSCASNVYNCH